MLKFEAEVEAVESIPVLMVNWNLQQPKQLPLPSEYSFRVFRRGDERVWGEIETAAGEFPSLSSALARFDSEFGAHIDEMEKRCIFLLYRDRAVGTATAWYRSGESLKKYNVASLPEGRLHWVAIRPEFQGRGLARPLIAEALYLLSCYHSSAYLTSQTKSFKAIKIYLDYGFLPVFTAPRAKEAWRFLAEVTQHPHLLDILELPGGRRDSENCEQISKTCCGGRDE